MKIMAQSPHKGNNCFYSSVVFFPQQEIKYTFKNFPSKEILCTDKPSCSHQPESSDSESSIFESSNIIQIIEENFNETQINKLGAQRNRWKIRNPSQPYYSRPAPYDLQLKTHRSLIQPIYDGNTVYQ